MRPSGASAVLADERDAKQRDAEQRDTEQRDAELNPVEVKVKNVVDLEHIEDHEDRICQTNILFNLKN